jgi:hypothetical protein
MPWTATILNSVNKGLSSDVAVSFTNGTNTFSTTFQDLADPSSVTALAAAQIEQLDAKDANPVTNGPVTIPAPAAASQADTDRAAFLEGYQKMQAMNRAAAAGITIDAAALASQKSLVNAQYLPAYLAFI